MRISDEQLAVLIAAYEGAGFNPDTLSALTELQSARKELAARTAPPGHIIDGSVVRKVLGTLPLTADGCVCGNGALVWRDWYTIAAEANKLGRKEIQWHYSTREAAEAAQTDRDG